MIDGTWAELDDLQADMERIWAARDRARSASPDAVQFTSAEAEQIRAALLRGVRAALAISNALGKEQDMHNGASTPYVSKTQTRHEPTTTTHTHDHAAHGHPDHDDGIHSHEHEHRGDAHHDHPHTFGTLRPGRVGQTGEAANAAGDGVYGRQMQAIGPAERARLRSQQLAAADARAMGQ